jgi:hypothetical protein
MAEVLLLHHAQGLTPGCLAFADELRAAGHVVHAPDLYDGKTFAELDDGIGYAREIGFDVVQEQGVRAADGLSNEMVYAGMSLGVMPAQMLAQTRPGAKGAVLLHASVPPSEFGGPWPPGVAPAGPPVPPGVQPPRRLRHRPRGVAVARGSRVPPRAGRGGPLGGR